MPEWTNGAVLKTAVSSNRDRGFESHSLRQTRKLHFFNSNMDVEM